MRKYTPWENNFRRSEQRVLVRLHELRVVRKSTALVFSLTIIRTHARYDREITIFIENRRKIEGSMIRKLGKFEFQSQRIQSSRRLSKETRLIVGKILENF